MTIRYAKTGDLRQMAVIYKQQFEKQGFSRFSIDLISDFFGYFLASCTVLVSENNGYVTGYLVGGSRLCLQEAFSCFRARNGVRCLKETVLRPEMCWHTLKRLPRLFFQVPSILYEPKCDLRVSRPRIAYLAVQEEAKGTGVAAKLVQAFEESLNGAEQYTVAIRHDNRRAMRFFAKMGFEIAGETSTYHILVRKVGSNVVCRDSDSSRSHEGDDFGSGVLAHAPSNAQSVGRSCLQA